jgi:hypothetical protein
MMVQVMERSSISNDNVAHLFGGAAERRGQRSEVREDQKAQEPICLWRVARGVHAFLT